MDKYISAEELKKHFPKDEDWDCSVNTNSLVCELIDKEPAADVVPVRRGKWEIIKDPIWAGGGCYKCSICGYGFSFEGYHDLDELSYCPDCGAKLNEEESEENTETLEAWNLDGTSTRHIKVRKDEEVEL